MRISDWSSDVCSSDLAEVSNDWRVNIGANKAVEWPVGIGGKGNEGVAETVAQTTGSIGYVEYAYALQNKMTYSKRIKLEGQTVDPRNKDRRNAVSGKAGSARGVCGGGRTH